MFEVEHVLVYEDGDGELSAYVCATDASLRAALEELSVFFSENDADDIHHHLQLLGCYGEGSRRLLLPQVIGSDDPGMFVEPALRRNGWVPTSELLSSGVEMPPLLAAFRELYSSAWDSFVEDVEDNRALTFFNTNESRYSHAGDWDELAELEGIDATHANTKNETNN